MQLEIAVLIILIIINAFFAASEIALISLNDNKIKSMAEAGHKKAKLLQALLNEPSRFLATIQIGITLAGFLASAFAGETFAGTLAELLRQAGIPLAQPVLETASLIIITLILSYFTLVLGELVPKRLAMQKAEPIAMFAAIPLTWLSKVSAPFVKLLTGSTNVLVRIMGVDPNANKEQVTEEEIRMMVDVGKENGAIEETEKIMINNIFEFNNKSVSEVITHRTRVFCIPQTISLQELIDVVKVEKFTRIPVYEGNIDRIVGILHVKDLFEYVSSSSELTFDVKDIMREPYFVPSSKHTDEVFKELQKNKTHLAVVLDEYGGMEGIVTVEDLIEEIVGNIFDEHDEEEKEIEMIGEHTYILNGLTPLRTVKEVLQIDLPVEEFDTLNGYITGALGLIPEQNEKAVVEQDRIVFTVQSVNDKRIDKVKAVRKITQESV